MKMVPFPFTTWRWFGCLQCWVDSAGMWSSLCGFTGLTVRCSRSVSTEEEFKITHEWALEARHWGGGHSDEFIVSQFSSKDALLLKRTTKRLVNRTFVFRTTTLIFDRFVIALQIKDLLYNACRNMHYASRIFSCFKWSLTILLKEDSLIHSFRMLFGFKCPCDGVCGRRVWSDGWWGSVSGWVGGERRSRAVELNSLQRTLVLSWGNGGWGCWTQSQTVLGQWRPLMWGQWPEAPRPSPGRSVWMARPRGCSQSPGSWPWRAAAGGWEGETSVRPSRGTPGLGRAPRGSDWVLPGPFPQSALWGSIRRTFPIKRRLFWLVWCFQPAELLKQRLFFCVFFWEQTLSCIKTAKIF